MMKTWRRYGVDKALAAAMSRNAVLCGSSAGSIAWFESGNSDSQKSEGNPTKLIRVRGLGFIDTLVCPHYDAEGHRKPSMKEMTRNLNRVSIGLDECCAIQIVDDNYRILSSVKGRGAYRVYWKDGVFHEDRIAETKELKPLGPLLKLY